MGKINHENYIWDLHIHTCCCPKGSSEFSEIKDIGDYIDLLVNIFKDYPDLTMISFTDHNQISKDVYKAFIERNTGIKVIPGIEVDASVYVNGNLTKDYKHVVFYFDDEAFDFDEHCKLINNFISLKINQLGRLPLNDFLSFLLTDIKVKFLISPHAFKQGKRGIDFDWCSEEITNGHLQQYTDQFFCFWETAGVSEIANGCKMLDDFHSGQKISLISFSDSNNSSKLKAYLSNPPQYFSALPTFDGLRMVGSEPRRISRSKEQLLDAEKGKYIGFIGTKGGSQIELSPKLNVIIGGRGSGKSIFLDSIYLNQSKGAENFNNVCIIKDKARRDYIFNLSFSATTMAMQNINSEFSIQYLQQNYVYGLFSDVSGLENKECFKQYFDRLDDFDIDTIRKDYLQKTVSLSADLEEAVVNTNLVNIDGRIVMASKSDNSLKIKSLKIKNSLKYVQPSDFLAATSAPRVVPPELKNNKVFLEAQKVFFDSIQSAIQEYNIAIEKENLDARIRRCYLDILDKKNKARKQKNEALREIRQRFNNVLTPYARRSKIIARIAQLQKLVTLKQKHEIVIQGVDGHKFFIVKELSVMEPLAYLHGEFIKNFDAIKLRNNGVADKKDRGSLLTMASLFIKCPKAIIMDSTNYEQWIETLESLSSWPISQSSRIYVEGNGGLVDLAAQSPGTRANYLMEFIVSEDKNIPLLIDQPEDNIDNETIAGKLTEWFLKMKNNRQLIVVTHDPNIVVNADAENVIVCKQKTDGAFEYVNGPLEQKESLNAVVTILEGGIDALERRIGKYGK